MNIDARVKLALTNLDRSLPPGFASVDEVVRAFDARPPGEVEAWLDRIAPLVRANDANARDFRAALQAAAALARETGVPLAELKRRAIDRVEGAAVHADAKLVSEGPGFVRPSDAEEQRARLDAIKRDFAAKARAAGQPLPDIGLDDQFKNAGEARSYIGQLCAGDMLYWAKQAFEGTARMEHAAGPVALRGIVLGTDYADVTGGNNPYRDYLIAKLDNSFSMPDIVDVLSKMKYYRQALSVGTQVSLLSKLLERRAGDPDAIEKMMRDVKATERDNQSRIVTRAFFTEAHDANPIAASALEAIGFEKHGLDMFGEIAGPMYPDRSALEKLASLAAARPAFKEFERKLGEKPSSVPKEALLEAIEAEIAKIKTPEEFVAFGLAFTGERYRYQFSDGIYRSDRRLNVLWDVMQRHHDKAAELGVSFDWMAAMAYAAYEHSIHMTDSGMSFEDTLEVMEPLMGHLKTPEQVDRLIRSSDQFIRRTFMNRPDIYPENYEKTWKKYRAIAVSHLAENFETVAIGKEVVPRCATVPEAIKAKQRMLDLADNLADVQAAMKLYFANPSEAYLRDNEQFVLRNRGALTSRDDFDQRALEELLAVQQFSPAVLAAIKTART